MKRSLLAAAMLLGGSAAAPAVELNCTTSADELHCSVASPPPSEPTRLWKIPREVSAGHMNIRSGPGTNHGLIGVVPAGATVSSSRCVPRDDGIAGAYWCLVNWNGIRGWVSQAGLMPIS
jgi:SH3-like domain-containing protein